MKEKTGIECREIPVQDTQRPTHPTFFFKKKFIVSTLTSPSGSNLVANSKHPPLSPSLNVAICAESRDHVRHGRTVCHVTSHSTNLLFHGYPYDKVCHTVDLSFIRSCVVVHGHVMSRSANHFPCPRVNLHICVLLVRSTNENSCKNIHDGRQGNRTVRR